MTSLRLIKSVLLVGTCALSVALFETTALNAADATGSSTRSDKAEKALPITATFEKGAESESGPYVLTLKNDSKESLNVGVKILLAVAFHAENKAKHLPEHVIEPGQTHTVPGLAAGDKVTVHAKGYAPLQLTVK